MASGPQLPKGPRVKIAITEQEINSATRRDSGHCMIADAISNSVPDAKYVSVDLASIRWTDVKSQLRYTYLTPRIAQIALLDFDQGREDIEPFSFQLRNPIVTRTEAGRRAVKSQGGKDSAKLHDSNTSQTQRQVPQRLGGRTPPLGALSNTARGVRVGKRREFGLRALEK